MARRLSVGLEGLSGTTRLQRTGLIENLPVENGEKPLAVMTRKVIKEEMKRGRRRRQGTFCRRAKANREKLGITGMEKIVAFDQSQVPDNFLMTPSENTAGTPAENKVVAFRSNFGKKA